MAPRYRDLDCPNCGRHRVLDSGTSEKCGWNMDRQEYDVPFHPADAGTDDGNDPFDREQPEALDRMG
jgi:hypothetical protein